MAWAAFALALATTFGHGVDLRWVEYKGVKLAVVGVDLNRAQLKLVWHGRDGKRLRTLHAARRVLSDAGAPPVAITNAGIFNDWTPSGLHVQDGRELHPINLERHGGNFFLLPNGVFFVDERGAGILESQAFARRAQPVKLATQSGPLLLQGGALHPKFTADSHNALPRSGVGVKSPHEIFLVVSEGDIRFWDFAVFFRDVLHCPDALYLDGNISRLYAPALGLDGDAGDFMGMLAVIAGP